MGKHFLTQHIDYCNLYIVLIKRSNYMNVRNSVLLKMTGVCLATVGTILSLNYLFGDWGLIIFWSGILAYLLYIMFQMQVDTESRKRQDLVDRLKK